MYFCKLFNAQQHWIHQENHGWVKMNEGRDGIQFNHVYCTCMNCRPNVLYICKDQHVGRKKYTTLNTLWPEFSKKTPKTTRPLLVGKRKCVGPLKNFSCPSSFVFCLLKTALKLPRKKMADLLGLYPSLCSSRQPVLWVNNEYYWIKFDMPSIVSLVFVASSEKP